MSVRLYSMLSKRPTSSLATETREEFGHPLDRFLIMIGSILVLALAVFDLNQSFNHKASSNTVKLSRGTSHAK